MTTSKRKNEPHTFSVELKSKAHVKCFSISEKDGGGVLIEGYLGGLEELGLIEGVMLEIKGTYGTLRMDLGEDDLKKILPMKKA